MSTFENIDGEKLYNLFSNLIRQQTLLNVSLPDTDFESLSVLTDIREDNDKFYFQIDPPDGLMAALSKGSPEYISFEFTGEGHLTHRFDAKLHDISQNSIWLVSPATVQRYQLRDNFRIKLLRKSYATIVMDDVRLRMQIDNISVGGVYCYCANLHRPLIEAHSKLTNMELQITTKNDRFSIQIDQVLVKRIEPWMRPKHFGVAFEFSQVHKATRQRLVQHIYDLQREFLKNRLKLNK